MIEKRDRFSGAFASIGDALDETIAMIDAMRLGKLSREDFDRWYEHRRRNLTEPISMVYDTGRRIFRGRRVSSARNMRRNSVRRSRTRKAAKAASTGMKAGVRSAKASLHHR